MSLSRFRLITFDATDTLLQFRSSPGRQYGEIGAMYGILFNNNKLEDSFRKNWHHMNKTHPNFGFKTKIGWENWWKMLIADTFRDNKLKISDDKMIQVSEHLVESYKTSACWQATYGALDFLNFLKQQQETAHHDGTSSTKSFKLGVISNFDPRLNDLIANMKLKPYFDFVINSYEVGEEKPDKAIFDRAIKESGIQDLQPQDCLHIGDTPITDYLGARNAGWYAALIHERDPVTLQKKYGTIINPNHVFRSLFDFHKKITSDNVSW